MEKVKKIIKGSSNKEILLDITFNDHIENKDIVLFSHGFKGFKDWGCFNLIADVFANHGFVFVKFNFSHNGTTISDPVNFTDLDSFGNNNFSKELDDLGYVIDWIDDSTEFSSQDISLIGHSRGGGISLLKSYEDERVTRVITWASPCNFLNRMPDEKIDIWKKSGVAFVYNGRTKQNMPMYIQFYDDCLENKTRLNIEKAVNSLTIPQLIIHGSADPTVDVSESVLLNQWSKKSELFIIDQADHVFGSTHPYIPNILPSHFQEVVDKTIDFIIQ